MNGASSSSPAGRRPVHPGLERRYPARSRCANHDRQSRASSQQRHLQPSDDGQRSAAAPRSTNSSCRHTRTKPRRSRLQRLEGRTMRQARPTCRAGQQALAMRAGPRHRAETVQIPPLTGDTTAGLGGSVVDSRSRACGAPYEHSTVQTGSVFDVIASSAAATASNSARAAVRSSTICSSLKAPPHPRAAASAPPDPDR